MDADDNNYESTEQQIATEDESQDSFFSAKYFSDTSNKNTYSEGSTPNMLGDVVESNFDKYSNTLTILSNYTFFYYFYLNILTFLPKLSIKGH